MNAIQKSEVLIVYQKIVQDSLIRLAHINLFIDKKIKYSDDYFNAEVMALQFRKICENIVFSSLVGNKVLFEERNINYHSIWQIKKLLDPLLKEDVGYYPSPYKEGRFQGENGAEQIHLEEIKDRSKFLTPENLLSLYSICNNFIHNTNPFKPKPDFNKFIDSSPKWRDQIVVLLELHKIKMHGTNDFLMCHLNPGRSGVPVVYWASTSF